MQNTDKTDLHSFVTAEWQRDVPHEVIVASKAIMGKFGTAASGVLFYGSCLRTGEIEDKILDFYVLVDSYASAYNSRWLAMANKILPPNVFYHEMDVGGVTVRSKYAVLSLADFAVRVGPKCLNVSVWARFCQPCVLLNAKDANVKQQAAGGVATAIKTMLGNYLDLMPSAATSRLAWVGAFEQTYAAELRSERAGKGLEIYLLDQERYDEVAPLAFDELGVHATAKEGSRVADMPLDARLKWMARRWNGKLVSFLRLVKATMTFDGGVDYIAWKIRRHSGVDVEVQDWMRNWPIFAGVVLFFKLRKTGAFK